jgi:glutamate synthase domain-containing protein 3
MKIIDCTNLGFKEICECVRHSYDSDIVLNNVVGQRYIASGVNGKNITINGVPGNALASYMDGCNIIVNSSVQDAVGDTMNDGKIIVHGCAGDATGYAMRGGKIFIRNNAGYRTGIHMKAYKEKFPLIIIGGKVGSFLGEYMAGGRIIVLNLEKDKDIVGNFTGVGMHGGKIFLRGTTITSPLPPQVNCEDASIDELNEIKTYIEEFANDFNLDVDSIMNEHFFVLKPNSANPYKRLYTAN